MIVTMVLVGIFVVLMVAMRMFQSRGVQQVGADEAAKLATDSTVTILDVRTPGEFSTGHLKKATLIPVSDLTDRIAELGAQKDKRILVYCASGNRSLSASQILRGNGFTNVLNLRGGVTAWRSRSLPLVN